MAQGKRGVVIIGHPDGLADRRDGLPLPIDIGTMWLISTSASLSLLIPEFHVNIKLSSNFSTGEVFCKDIPLEYHLKIKSPQFTFIRVGEIIMVHLSWLKRLFFIIT